VANQNAKDLEISAHTIKGSLSIYLYKPIVQTAFELEKIGRSGDFQSAQLMLGNLESQLTNFTHELQAFAANN
jgi:HPt (histidine-containing phosphotransfer) domain-containing protein